MAVTPVSTWSSQPRTCQRTSPTPRTSPAQSDYLLWVSKLFVSQETLAQKCLSRSVEFVVHWWSIVCRRCGGLISQSKLQNRCDLQFPHNQIHQGLSLCVHLLLLPCWYEWYDRLSTEGLMEVNMTEIPMEEMELKFSKLFDIEFGGHWKPKDCKPRWKVSL